MKEVLEYLETNHDSMLEELKEYLRIPSISTGTKNTKDIAKAADFTQKQLKKIGLKNVKIHKTKGHPIVYGEWLGAKGAPTVLVYGHYDVQPVEPLNLWNTDPFDPTVKDGKLFARGSADDKGQVFIHFKVLEAFMKTQGKMPVNVKVVVEGEEEIGSPNLVTFLNKNKKMLACDTILISDTHMEGEKKPTITYGLRGLTYLQVDVTSAKGDLHSGTFGGSIANPIQVLSEILVKCKDPKTSKVKIPGFYKDVVPLKKKEREELAKMPHSDQKFAKSIGAKKTFGEAGYTTVERTGSRPTFEVNGIWGGHTGDGVKTVLPAEAHAKVSMRLVANQDPDTIARLFTDYVKSIAPDTVKINVTLYDNNGNASLSPIDSPGMVAAQAAVKKVYKKAPFLTREGGSIPIVADMQKALKAAPVLLGFGLPDDNLHAPNEKMNIVQITNGYKTVTHWFEEYAKATAK